VDRGFGLPALGRRHRLPRSVGGIVLFVAGLAVLAYMRVVVPAGMDLDLECKVKEPPGTSVEVKHSHSLAYKHRREPYEWTIEIEAALTNRTGSPVSPEIPTVSFRDPGGGRIRIREPFIDTLSSDRLWGLVGPGETRTYRTQVPMRIRARSGKRKVVGTIRFE